MSRPFHAVSVLQHTDSSYHCGMGEALRQRLQQRSFESPYQEAMLSVLVCADLIQRQMEIVCQQHGITAAQYNVLRILRGAYPAGHARCDIIKRMIQQSPDVTRLIGRLEKLEFVRRGSSDHDGRLSVTTITDKGLALLAAMDEPVAQIHRTMAERISEREAKTMTRLCERLHGT